MDNKIKKSASYIVSNEILRQTNEFTVEDIFNKVKFQLNSMFEDINNLKEFIKNKVNSLCDLGLISGTGIFYYVLA